MTTPTDYRPAWYEAAQADDFDAEDHPMFDSGCEMLGFALIGLAGVVSLLALAAFLYFVR